MRIRARLSAALHCMIAGVVLAPPGVHAGEVQVAVAANFAGPFERIAADFNATTGHKARAAIGSTGKFYAQIRNGAPFEVLLAADDETPRRLVAEGQAGGANLFTYAVGKLVLWSAKADRVDPEGKVLSVNDASMSHLAIGDARTVPYGKAAEQALRALGLYERLKPRFVVAESVAQVYQFTVTGNAEVGFVALSQVSVPGKPASGSMWLVPQALYEPIRQDAVLLRKGEDNEAARALMQYLKSDKARAVIRAYGYES